MVDYVITDTGQLLLGNGHWYMSGGAQKVRGAGGMKVVNGIIVEINNHSGHYVPSPDEFHHYIQQLQRLLADDYKTGFLFKPR